MENNRILYIDASKGVAIILVLMGHILLFSLKLEESVIFQTISKFHVAIFIFVSGYLYGKRSNTSFYYMVQKAKMLLFPFFFIGGLYALIHSVPLYDGFVTDNMKMGYWFLWVLFEIFFVFIILLNLLNLLLKKRKICFDILLLGSASLAMQLVWYKSSLSEVLMTSLSWNLLTKNYFIFFLGYIANIYALRVEKYYLSAWAFTVWIIGFCVMYYCYELLGYVANIFMSLSGCFSVLYLLKVRTTNRYLMNILSYIGKRSLAIYALHYFFLLDLSNCNSIFVDNRNVVLLLLVLLFCTFLIIIICLLFEWIFMSSPFLGLLLFGKRK